MSQSDLWSVAIAPDNIQTMTLDQLDDAFQKGLITENALVWTEGMDSWERLEEVLGGDEPAEEAAPAVAAPTPMPVARIAPVAATLPMGGVLSAAPSAPAQSAPISLAPHTFTPPQSTAPVAMNMGDDLELNDFGGGKKTKWGYLVAAAVVIGGVGFTVANTTVKTDINPSKAAAAAVALPPSPGDEPLHIPAARDPNAPLAGGGGYKISATEEAKMKAEAEKAEEQRAKIAEALANRPPELEPKAKPKRKGGGGGQRAQRQQSSPIKKGGSKFDPLNGSLD